MPCWGCYHIEEPRSNKLTPRSTSCSLPEQKWKTKNTRAVSRESNGNKANHRRTYRVRAETPRHRRSFGNVMPASVSDKGSRTRGVSRLLCFCHAPKADRWFLRGWKTYTTTQKWRKNKKKKKNTKTPPQMHTPPTALRNMHMCKCTQTCVPTHTCTKAHKPKHTSAQGDINTVAAQPHNTLLKKTSHGSTGSVW